MLWLKNETKFAYSADGLPSSVSFPAASSNVDKYAYNEADQMKEASFTKGAEVLASLVYTRDSNGQVKGITSKGLPGEEKPTYEYDANNRLTKAGTAKYEYDSADNPTKIGSGAYKYDKADQLETGPSLTYTYDEIGERTKTKPTKGPATTYGYDQAGRLTTVARPKEGEVTGIEDSYSYDGDGLRASQTISGTTTFLTWDNASQISLALNDGSNNYIYGLGGLPIEQISTGGTVLYLHHDQAGSTRMLTSSTGAKEASSTFDAYGNTTGTTGTAKTPLGYDSQLTSSDTGLIYLRARVYDPATAQFLTVDPLGTRAPYTYGDDNAVNQADPTGLKPLCLDLSWICSARGWVETNVEEPLESALAYIHANEFGQASDVLPSGSIGDCGTGPIVFGGAQSGGGAASINQMNRAISRGQAPPGVARVDPSVEGVPGSQDHVHLTGQRATLNRDGTWGHGDEGELTNAIKTWLREFGWEVP